MSKLINNFSGAGAVTLTSAPAVTVGSTLYGITITGEVLVGNQHRHDFLFGTSGNDDIVGGPRTDYLSGGRGDDVLTGGSSGPNAADVFSFKPGSGHDVITDFQGQDEINIARYLRHGDNVTVSDTGAGAVIDLGTGDTITLLGVDSSQLVQTAHGFALGHLLVG